MDVINPHIRITFSASENSDGRSWSPHINNKNGYVGLHSSPSNCNLEIKNTDTHAHLHTPIYSHMVTVFLVNDTLT